MLTKETEFMLYNLPEKKTPSLDSSPEKLAALRKNAKAAQKTDVNNTSNLL